MIDIYNCESFKNHLAAKIGKVKIQNGNPFYLHVFPNFVI